MGCCISKCRPRKHNSLQPTQLPVPQCSISNQISVSPPSPASPSTSSLSSFTCTTASNTLTSTSSLSSTASSTALTSKDRSFSNDFLWSCYQHNPHILRIHSLKQASLSSVPPKADRSTNFHIHPSPTKQKRVRSNSPPNLTRQKSFRKLPERPNSSALYNLPTRTLRSPSPSHTFINAHKCGSPLHAPITDSSVSRPMIAPKRNAISPLLRKQNVKGAASPINTSQGLRSSLRQRQSCGYRIGAKIDEAIVNEVVASSDHDMVSTLVKEDINNPLIALDCFIFL